MFSFSYFSFLIYFFKIRVAVSVNKPKENLHYGFLHMNLQSPKICTMVFYKDFIEIKNNSSVIYLL